MSDEPQAPDPVLKQSVPPTPEFAEISVEPLARHVQPRGRIYDCILDTIGNTPMVRVPKLQEKYGLQAEILAKLEFFNPLASVKDRIAYAMIEAAERAGKISPDKTTLIEPTSGNTGIGLAFVAAYKGYKLVLTMPESMSLERRKMLRFFGAELVLTPAENGMKGAIDEAERLLRDVKGAVEVGQFKNEANPQIHRETTAEEIWADTGGDIDILVAGVGTGGSVTGISQVLKQKNPNFLTYGVEPTESPVISGGDPGPHKIQGIGAGFIPDTLDTEMIDQIVHIDSELAISTAREVASLEGIPCGISSGAAFAAAIQVAQVPDFAGKKIAVIIPSFAERYISTPLFDNMVGN